MAQSDHVTINGLRLSCRKAGKSSQPCLVLLHGWPQTSLAWETILDDLGQDQYALAFDLPGIGDSRGVPPSAEKTALAGVILSAAEGLGGRDIILAGYDVGGMIAFAGARDHASRLRGAVVINTVIPGLHPWTRVISDPRIFHFALHNIRDLPERWRKDASRNISISSMMRWRPIPKSSAARAAPPMPAAIPAVRR